MDLTVHLPDELVAHLGGEAVHDQLERRAQEAFALEEFRAERITEIQLRKMPGLERIELDGFLKAHGSYSDISMEDIELDIADLHACLGR